MAATGEELVKLSQLKSMYRCRRLWVNEAGINVGDTITVPGLNEFSMFGIEVDTMAARLTCFSPVHYASFRAHGVHMTDTPKYYILYLQASRDGEKLTIDKAIQYSIDDGNAYDLPNITCIWGIA